MSENVDRFPLSLQVDFLRMMDRGGGVGPFGPKFIVGAGWRVSGEIDTDALRAAMDDVVARQETLRTRIITDDGDPYLRVYPPSSPELVITTLAGKDRDLAADEFIDEIENGEFGVDEIPGLKVFLARFDDRDAVLAFVGHHTWVDGFSVQLVGRELAGCYAARRAGQAPDLPEVRQYRDFVAWQLEHAAGPEAAKSQEFWRETLQGARITALPSDRPRSEGVYTTGWHRFMLDDDIEPIVQALARRTRSTPFMVLLGAYLTVLSERTGTTDLVVPTFLPGRPGWAMNTIGTFYNFTPLRVEIGGATGLTDVVARVRATCLKAYQHELTFPQIMQVAHELMNDVVVPTGGPVAFQVIQSPFMRGVDEVGELRYTAIRKRVVSTPVGPQIPDGMLMALELHPGGGIGGRVGYTDMFDESTVVSLLAGLVDVLRANAVDQNQRVA